MADYCCICDTVRPEGGTNGLVLNGGKVWIEFCKECGKTEKLTNAETGEIVTLQELFDRIGDSEKDTNE